MTSSWDHHHLDLDLDLEPDPEPDPDPDPYPHRYPSQDGDHYTIDRHQAIREDADHLQFDDRLGGGGSSLISDRDWDDAREELAHLGLSSDHHLAGLNTGRRTTLDDDDLYHPSHLRSPAPHHSASYDRDDYYDPSDHPASASVYDHPASASVYDHPASASVYDHPASASIYDHQALDEPHHHYHLRASTDSSFDHQLDSSDSPTTDYSSYRPRHSSEPRLDSIDDRSHLPLDPRSTDHHDRSGASGSHPGPEELDGYGHRSTLWSTDLHHLPAHHDHLSFDRAHPPRSIDSDLFLDHLEPSVCSTTSSTHSDHPHPHPHPHPHHRHHPHRHHRHHHRHHHRDPLDEFQSDPAPWSHHQAPPDHLPTPPSQSPVPREAYLADLGAPSYRSPRTSYSTHLPFPHHDHPTPRSQLDDPDHTDHPFHPSERLSQPSSEVERVLAHSALHDLDDRPLAHPRTPPLPELDPRRDDIERIRAQLDESLAASGLLHHPVPQRPRSRSWERSPGRLPIDGLLRSPHPRPFEPPSLPLDPLASHSTLHRPPSRPLTPLSVGSHRRSPHSNLYHDTWHSPAPLHRTLSRPQTPPSIRSGRRSPSYSNLYHDPWHPPTLTTVRPLAGEPVVSPNDRMTRTSSILGNSSGGYPDRPSSRSSTGRVDSLGHQLNQIEALNDQIRESERAHQRELALANVAANELAQRSFADDLHRSQAAAHQRELALANVAANELAQRSFADDLHRSQAAAHQREALTNELHRSEAVHRQELALANQHVSQLAHQSLLKDLHRNEIAHQRDLILSHQDAASRLDLQSGTLVARENDIYRDLDRQRRELDLERARIARQRDRVDSQTQLGVISRQLESIDRQREIDRNRQLANLSRFGNLPSVLRGHYAGRPLASPYLQQSRFLSAARRWSDRDRSRHHRLPVVYDHVDAYYRLMSDHLPKQLPMFRDPYYSHHSRLPTTTGGIRSRLSDPFVDGIDYDYGYGRVGTLGLQLERFAREEAYILDDLYLFELLLRLDESIDELERQRRWNARLRWEEWADSRSRVEAWSRMSSLERKRLGLSDGSYWASSLFGIPLDSRFGYSSGINFSRYRPSGLHPHYTLTSRLSSRYPMWSRGGLGLGRRISKWYDYTRPYVPQKYLDRRDRIHREYAQRRGELAPGSILNRSPGSMLTGNLKPLGGLDRTNSIRQRLNPLTGSRSTTSLTGGLSRVPSSASRNLTGLTGTSNLSSTSIPGLSSLKQSLLSSISLPPPTSSSIPSLVPTLANSQRNLPMTAAIPSKNISTGSSSLGSNHPKLAVPKPIPLNSSSPSTVNVVRPTPTGSRSSTTTTSQQSLVSPGSTSTRRSRTPTGQSIQRSTTPTVIFNPRVKAVPPESESDPPLVPRPPSRTSMRPSRSALKTPPPSTKTTTANSVVSQLDEARLESITKLNTERNRSTPAPPDHDDHRATSSRSPHHGTRASN